MKTIHWMGGGLAILVASILGYWMRLDTGVEHTRAVKAKPGTRDHAGSGLQAEDRPAHATDSAESSRRSVSRVVGSSKKAHTSSCSCTSCGGSAPLTAAAEEARPSMKITGAMQNLIFSLAKDSTLTVALPGGGSATGTVQMTRQENGRTVMVQGVLTAPRKGMFFFQKQSMPGVAGEMVGVVRFDQGNVAYRVEPAEDGSPVLREQHVDRVICRNYSPQEVAKGATAEAPDDHPSDMGIPAYQNGVVSLESLPGAPAVLYLDFDGQEGAVAGWSVVDAAPSGLTNAQIRDTWEHVAEDFAPFNVNVTTDLQVYQAAAENSRQRCLISPSSPVGSGVAYVGSFNWTGDTPCWAGYRGSKVGHEVLSHELGHTLGLSHDGRTTPSEGYYGGHGTGEVAWAPIMGNSYYKNLSQWSKGEYLNANQTQDDLAIMTGNNNNVDYRADDHAETLALATYLEIQSDDSVRAQGVVETGADRDAFRFTTTATGAVTLAVNPAVHSPNLDILAEIVDSGGLVVASDNPDLALAATVTVASLPAGDYTLRVSGVGRGDVLVDGYSDYASLGHYEVSGSVPNGIKPDRMNIAENSANTMAVGTVNPRNNHGADPVVFTIASGNGGGAFSINASTGALTVADSSQFDYESLSGYYDDLATFELFVDITNATTPSLNETVRVVVSVDDVNEAHSIVGASTAEVYQHASAGTRVADFWTQGEDHYDSMDWAIVSGNTGGAFAINSEGVVTVADSAALALQGSYTLQISATDNGPPLPTMVANHTVTITTLLWNPGKTLVIRNWTQEPGVSASQSTTTNGGDASRAIDGNTNGAWANNSVTHTDSAVTNSWWEVDLGVERSIGSVVLHNRTDCCAGRLSNFRVSVLNASHVEVAGQDYYLGSGAVGGSEQWTLPTAATGRYVRVQLYGSNNEGNGVLSLAEVVVNEALPENVALSGGLSDWTQQAGVTASQSTTASGGDASRAIDGNTSGVWSNSSVTHTDPSGVNSWWEVDLAADRPVEFVTLHNRTDCCASRLSNFRVSILDASRTELAGQNFYEGSGNAAAVESWQLLSRVVGRYVRVELLGQNNDGNGVISLAEVQVFGNNDANAPLAMQATTTHGGIAARAIDGNTDGNFSNGSVTHTDGTSDNWFELKLSKRYSLEQIVLYNRTDGNSNRLSNFRVSVWDGATEVYGTDHFTAAGSSVGSIFSLSKLDGMVGDKVRIELLGTNSGGDKVLSLAELQVYGEEYPNQAPVADDATLAVAENSSAGTSVGSVNGSDPDTGDTLSYTITAGNSGGEFAINNSTGEITTTTPLDYETTSQYVLTIEITDDGIPALSDTATVTVTVTDVLEITAPVVSTGAASSITQTSADVAYSVTDDGGEDATVTIYYGESNGGTTAGNWTNNVAAGALSTGSYSSTLSGLTEGTTYYYTVHASNSAGEAWGSSGSFTTEADTSPKLVRTTVNGVSNGSWTNVNLGQSYNSAVIIATPIYPNSTIAPVVTRIRNVSGSGFEVKIDRTDGLTGTVNVDVSIVAVEEGVYTQATDGVTMEAVKYTSTITGAKNAWTAEARTYQNSYTNPVVVGQVMSANDADWSTFWCHGSSRTNPPNASSLNVGKQVAEDPDTTRADETVGYIVIESGSGTINGVAYSAGVGGDIVRGTGNTSVGYDYSLSGLSSAGAAAASIAGLDGGDGGWAVLYGATPMSATTLTLAVDEDQLSNSERNHTTEQLGYIVFE